MIQIKIVPRGDWYRLQVLCAMLEGRGIMLQLLSLQFIETFHESQTDIKLRSHHKRHYRFEMQYAGLSA